MRQTEQLISHIACLTITRFASLTLNTPSSAHNKIFGAKFSSFEQFALSRSHTVHYAVRKHNTPQTKVQNKPLYIAIEPL